MRFPLARLITVAATIVAGFKPTLIIAFELQKVLDFMPLQQPSATIAVNFSIGVIRVIETLKLQLSDFIIEQPKHMLRFMETTGSN